MFLKAAMLMRRMLKTDFESGMVLSNFYSIQKNQAWTQFGKESREM